jgi:hypothetical protein
MPAPKIAIHGRGRVTAAQLNVEIAQTWEKLLDTEAGRKQIADALGLKLEDIQPRALKQIRAPFSATAASGFGGTDLLIMGEWLATNMAVPVLVSLATNVAEERLTALWKNVVLPRLQSKGVIKGSKGAVKGSKSKEGNGTHQGKHGRYQGKRAAKDGKGVIRDRVS